jgi:hypothetical protein
VGLPVPGGIRFSSFRGTKLVPACLHRVLYAAP